MSDIKDTPSDSDLKEASTPTPAPTPTPANPEQSAPAIARVPRRRKGVKDHLQEPFLLEYEKSENQSQAGAAVGVSHETVSQWKKDPAFMKLFTAAHIRAQSKNNDNLKASALQRAINGNPNYLIRQGAFVLDEKGNKIVASRDFETQLTMFMLKNRMPQLFKDKFEHEITGQVILSLASEFFAIVRKHVPPQLMPAIQKELETLSAKLAVAK